MAFQPWIWLVSPDKPNFYDEVGGFIWGEALFPAAPFLFDGELDARVIGLSTITASLSQVVALRATIGGSASILPQLQRPDFGVGFEIPYLLGIGNALSLVEAEIIGASTITANLLQLARASAPIAGLSTITANLTVLGSDDIAARPAGTTAITAELFVNATTLLAATITGSSLVQASIFTGNFAFDPRSKSHMYIYSNIGVAFDPTDTYTGATQTFPDGHTRDDFWEYLYIYMNIGVGFDPTDDASDHPNFESQTFPDGHTAFDFHEYLYLYLNVVRGRQQHGQLVIRPGFTKGAILPSAKPPRIEPQ